MMAHKQLLHELLDQDQEPFQLKAYIAQKRSQFNNPSPNVAAQTSCFSSFNYSPEIDFPPPPIATCKSTGVLHVPSETAAVLIEAAMRIKNQQRPKVKSRIEKARLRFFGSFLRVVKNRSKNRGDFALSESRFCGIPSSSGRCAPEFCSPADFIPGRRHVKQEKGNKMNGEGLNYANGGEEKKEQCSPVSVLSFYEDEGRESVDVEKDAYDPNCSYANIERTKQLLLNRLRRFEELAALDAMEFESTFLEDSDDEFQRKTIESDFDADEQFWLRTKRDLNSTKVEYNRRNMDSDVKRLVWDVKGKGNSKIMMVDLDLEWGNFWEEMAKDLEVAIFGVLVEELLHDLFYFFDPECR